MRLPEAVERAAAEARALVRLGFPWWLRPWLAKDVVAITLGRRVYVRPSVALRPPKQLERLLRHELAHVAQVNRLGLPRFLWRYTSEFVGHWWRVRSVAAAYGMISFEIEAAAAEEPYNSVNAQAP